MSFITKTGEKIKIFNHPLKPGEHYHYQIKGGSGWAPPHLYSEGEPQPVMPWHRCTAKGENLITPDEMHRILKMEIAKGIVAPKATSKSCPPHAPPSPSAGGASAPRD